MIGSLRQRLAFPGVSAARCHSRTFATEASLRKLPREGEHIHGFVLKRSQRFEELQLTALELQHTKTGADYLHIARDDSNNVFSIGFKTNPPDASGVPHILEHTTLCGSEKYPVRDPFFKMLPRSLSNFMNAFTSADHTTYPFSTTNAQDFRNLLSVYLDATLHPLLSKSDFEQEGWRVGPENPEAVANASNKEDAPQKLVFKGVVYNEMKGQMSDASYLYYIRYHEHIFPAINNSGGDPQAMTNLTWEELRRFHREHYHPSNAKIFTYGDMPLEDHLVEVNRQLAVFEQLQLDKAIKAPIELSSPKQVTLEGPIDPLTNADAQYKTSESWMLGDSSDVHESFALGIISQLLLDGYGSPLYRALIEDGLGMDWSANTGLDTAGKRGIFCVGLNGVQEDNVAKVKTTIQSVFRQMRQSGFDRNKIDGILHQMDLGLKHKTANFGMNLMHRVQAGWFNGVDPFDSLAWKSIVDTFKTRLSEGGYLEGLLEKYFLTDNTLTFTMRPSETYGQTIAQEEAKRLEGKLADLTSRLGTDDKMRQELTAQELALLEKQNAEQDLSCLPMVRVADIPRQGVYKSTSETQVNDSPTQWRTTGTNGLTYFRGLNVLEGLSSEMRLLLPLFSDAIMRIGTKNKSMEEIEDLIKAKTGGLSFGHAVLGNPTNSEIASEAFSISGFALDSNVGSMLDLLRMIVHETDFESEKAAHMIKELLQSSANGALDNVASSGHSYARKYAESGLSLQGYLTEQVSGLDQVFYSAAQASLSVDVIAASLIEKLRQIQQFALTQSDKLRMAITCDQAAVQQNETHLAGFVKHLQAPKSSSSTKLDKSLMQTTAKTFFPLPYQVYYSATSIPTVPYTHDDSAPLAILAQLLTHQHLHREIREKGGAYGGGAYSKGLSGLFGFYSYRDPNPQNTVKVVADAGRWAREKTFSDEQLESAKLSVFQGLDAPESVNQEGMTKFLSGITPEMEQKKREQLLDVTHGQVRDVADKYIIGGYAKSRSVILGEKQPWLAESSDWTVKSSQLGA